jgi:cytochrome d ubiquinol oxidase subunit II
MIPFALTVEQAASPRESLTFMFWGAGLFVMPLTLIYTLVVYRLFHGKVADVGYE